MDTQTITPDAPALTESLITVTESAAGKIRELLAEEGKTESGIPVVCLVTRVAVHKDQDTSQFERELAEQRPPSSAAIEAIPLRMII